LANKGLVGAEIAEQLDLPESLAGAFGNRGYYGTVSHNAKAVYQRYFGWFDGNPANLHPLPPEPASTRYVEYMGGAAAVLARAREDFEAGEYRWVAQVVNHVVFADPGNTEARELQAAALEQLGFQAESGPWRNFYLTGALELRRPRPAPRTPAAPGATARPAAGRSPLVEGMTVEMVFDSLGVRLDGPRADAAPLSIGWSFPDIGEQWTLRVEHGALNCWPALDDDVDAVASMSRETLIAAVTGAIAIPAAVEDGSIALEGDGAALDRLFGLLEEPDRAFSIIEP
jgi:alkyl sulfatase BDS1-like metallo-beta-lactamase superfamily hydrolase